MSQGPQGPQGPQGLKGVGPPPPKPDGTEGTATVTLTLNDEHDESKTIVYKRNGLIISSRNNEDFKNFLNTDTQNIQFFIYFCSIDLPESWKDCLVKYEIKVHRFTKNDDKFYTIDKNAAEGILVKGSKADQIFLPLVEAKFNLNCTSKFPKFLKDYSKNFKRDQQQIDCEKLYKGLIKCENSLVKFVEITFSRDNNRLELRYKLFDKLVDGPLLLCSNGKEYAVGWCAKARDNNSKITWYKFKPQGSDITEIWKASCDQPDSVQPAPEGASSTSQPAPEGASSTSQPTPEGASSSSQPTPEGASSTSQPTPEGASSTSQPTPEGASSTSQPTPEGASSTSQPTPEGASSTSQPTPEGASIAGQPIQEPLTLMKDLIQTNSKVKDCLKNGLDYEYRLLSNWRHLADQLKDPAVPQDVKEACKSATIHSPTWEVLGRPDICIKPVQELMDKLNGNGLMYRRCDVHLLLRNGIPEADRSESIEDVLLNKVDLMDNIAIKLDSPGTRVTKNWKYFALQLGIKNDELDLIARGNNPAEQLLQHVYRTLPSEKKSAGEFRRIIMGFDNRPDLQKFVTDVGIENNNDLRTLEDIIPNDSEEMKKVTALLNKSTGGVKNWKTLARIWGIDDSVYNTFDPPSRLSPTDTLLEWLCNINSQVSVKVFLNILGEKMKRYDIKEELEKIIQN